MQLVIKLSTKISVIIYSIKYATVVLRLALLPCSSWVLCTILCLGCCLFGISSDSSYCPKPCRTHVLGSSECVNEYVNNTLKQIGILSRVKSLTLCPVLPGWVLVPPQLFTRIKCLLMNEWTDKYMKFQEDGYSSILCRLVGSLNTLDGVDVFMVIYI